MPAATLVQPYKVSRIRKADQFAGQIVSPAMKTTNQSTLDGAGLLANERAAAVSTSVVERTDLIVVIPQNQNG